MAQIDASIPLGIKPPQTGLAQLGQTVDTARGLIGLQSASQQLGANQIISQAYQQATDPQTGQVDFGKLQALATQGGAGAFLPDFMAKIASQRNQQLTYDTGKLELALKQQTDIRNRIGSLMSSPNYGKGDLKNEIIGAMGQALASGTLPLEQAQREVASIPGDPAAQAEWIKQHYLNSLSGEAKIQAMLPRTQVLNTGGQTQVLNIDPLTGKPSIAGSLQNTLTPGEASAEVPGVTPEGTPYTMMRAQRLQQMQGGSAPAAGQPGYTGRFPGAQGSAGGAPNGLPAGALQTGLSPAQQASQSAGATAQAGQSAAAAQRLADEANNTPMQVNLLNTARDALSQIKTGPGTDWRNTFASALQSTPMIGDALKAMGVNDPNKIASYDEFKKIMTNYASSISGSVGSGTDARLNAAITGNANPNISNLANDDILVKTLAGLKMRQAQNYAWQNSGNSPDKFNQWQSQWNKAVDPATFAYSEMTPEQRSQFASRQGKSFDSFMQNFRGMIRQGIIQMPGGQ
ncbi:hypothetical protein [Cupriavidus basilensis]|uniref:hypothetical protein n=1 Tax=Cupriavidus basilensis TaxID=68895 RepID=UPI000750B4AD|nr:hypothetical protein [Cupriavidus basilensis]